MVKVLTKQLKKDLKAGTQKQMNQFCVPRALATERASAGQPQLNAALESWRRSNGRSRIR
jgi:hypothetical protein